MGTSTQIGLVPVPRTRAKWLVAPIGEARTGSESKGTMFRTDPAWSDNGGRLDELPVTAAAYAALESERDKLRHEKLHQLPERLRRARENGDASSNDEHLAIREDEAVLDARLRRLEDILGRARVVAAGESEDTVAIGSSVTVLDTSSGDAVDYVVDGAHAVAKPRSVSATSPVGRALLGRRIGDVVTVSLPRKGRTRELEILAIS